MCELLIVGSCFAELFSATSVLLGQMFWDYFGINNNPKKSKHGTRMYPDKILPRRPCTGWKGSWEGTFAPGADLGAGVNPVYEISMPSGSVPDARK